jgi:hypothetical protein
MAAAGAPGTAYLLSPQPGPAAAMAAAAAAVSPTAAGMGMQVSGAVGTRRLARRQARSRVRCLPLLAVLRRSC